MEIKAGVAEMFQPFAKLVKRPGAAAERHGHFHALAEVEAFETRLRRELRVSFAEIPDHAAKIASQGGNRSVIADVEGRELLGKVIPIHGGQRPLREIVGKTFGEEVMDAQGLKGVVKNGRVAAVFEPGQQFREGSSRWSSDAREVGGGHKIEGCFGDVQFNKPLPL